MHEDENMQKNNIKVCARLFFLTDSISYIWCTIEVEQRCEEQNEDKNESEKSYSTYYPV